MARLSSSLRNRIIQAEGELLRSSTTESLQTFNRKWSLLCDDLTKTIEESEIESSDLELVYAISSRVALITGSLAELEDEAEKMFSNIVDDISLNEDDIIIPTGHLKSSSSIHLPSYVPAAYRWLAANVHNPYPPSSLKRSLARDAGVTVRSVDEWFKNCRAQIGWVSLCKEHFAGKRSLAVAAAESVFDRGDGSLIPSAVTEQFYTVKDRLNILYHASQDLIEEVSLSSDPVRRGRTKTSNSNMRMQDDAGTSIYRETVIPQSQRRYNIFSTTPSPPSRTPSLVFSSSDSEEDELSEPEHDLGEIGHRNSKRTEPPPFDKTHHWSDRIPRPSAEIVGDRDISVESETNVRDKPTSTKRKRSRSDNMSPGPSKRLRDISSASSYPQPARKTRDFSTLSTTAPKLDDNYHPRNTLPHAYVEEVPIFTTPPQDFGSLTDMHPVSLEESQAETTNSDEDISPGSIPAVDTSYLPSPVMRGSKPHLDMGPLPEPVDFDGPLIFDQILGVAEGHACVTEFDRRALASSSSADPPAIMSVQDNLPHADLLSTQPSSDPDAQWTQFFERLTQTDINAPDQLWSFGADYMADYDLLETPPQDGSYDVTQGIVGPQILPSQDELRFLSIFDGNEFTFNLPPAIDFLFDNLHPYPKTIPRTSPQTLVTPSKLSPRSS